jgi:hypothetical protein
MPTSGPLPGKYGTRLQNHGLTYQPSQYKCACAMHSHRQMSMPKPVCPNMATVTPIASAGPGRRRSSTPGGLRWARSHPPPESIFPRARDGRSLPRCGELTSRTSSRHRAPNREPGRILIPGDGAAGDQGLRTGLPPGDGGYATPAACPVSTDFLALWSQAQMPSCNRQVTSTSIDIAEPGRLALRRRHAPL